MGTQLTPPPKKKGGAQQSPIFDRCLLWPKAVCIRILLGTEIGLSLGDIVLDGNPAPLPKLAQPPQFSANACCGQMAGWPKMPLTIEICIDPGDSMATQVPPRKKSTAPPKYGPYLLWLNGWMDQNATRTEVNVGPSDVVLDGVFP